MKNARCLRDIDLERNDEKETKKKKKNNTVNFSDASPDERERDIAPSRLNDNRDSATKAAAYLRICAYDNRDLS